MPASNMPTITISFSFDFVVALLSVCPHISRMTTNENKLANRIKQQSPRGKGATTRYWMLRQARLGRITLPSGFLRNPFIKTN